MKKFGKHQTIHSSLKKVIEMLLSLPSIDRIIIGPSKGVRHNRPVGSFRLQKDVYAGIRMCGYSDRGITQFTIITISPITTRLEINEKFHIEED